MFILVSEVYLTTALGTDTLAQIILVQYDKYLYVYLIFCCELN